MHSYDSKELLLSYNNTDIKRYDNYFKNKKKKRLIINRWHINDKNNFWSNY